MMKYLFIPTDRIGFNSYQDSISHTTSAVFLLIPQASGRKDIITSADIL